MTAAGPTLAALELAVFEGDVEGALAAIAEASAEGAEAQQIVNALTAGIERIRGHVGAGRLATAEILVSLEAFREGIRALRGRGELLAAPDRAGIVIGVVPGDVHDLGKNIVAVVLEAAGHPVVDVGRDAMAEAFIAAIERTSPRPGVVALSTMMSTTLENMRRLVRDLRRFDHGLAIIAGGAALDARVARSLGADGYADSAATAPGAISRLLAGRR